MNPDPKDDLHRALKGLPKSMRLQLAVFYSGASPPVEFYESLENDTLVSIIVTLYCKMLKETKKDFWS